MMLYVYPLTRIVYMLLFHHLSELINVLTHVTLKQLNTLTSIDTFSCFGGLHATVREDTGTIPDSRKPYNL